MLLFRNFARVQRSIERRCALALKPLAQIITQLLAGKSGVARNEIRCVLADRKPVEGVSALPVFAPCELVPEVKVGTISNQRS
jgi:hypothetical protein